MVTHDPTAAAYADRLLVLADGGSCTTARPRHRRGRPRPHEGGRLRAQGRAPRALRPQAAARPHGARGRARRHADRRRRTSSPTRSTAASTASSPQSTKGMDASVTPRKTIDTTERRRHAADRLAGRPRAGPPAAAACRAPRARSSTSAPCSTRRASAIGAGGAPNFISLDRRPAALRRVHGQGGPQARGRPTRSRWTPATAKKKDFKLGDRIAVSGDRAAQGLHARRHHADRRRRLVRRRDGRRACSCPRRSACSASAGFDQIQVGGASRA